MSVAPANPLLVTVPKALELGWTIATLYNPPVHAGAAQVDQLPTEHELDEDSRRDVELRRLTCLIADLVQAGVGTLGDASTAAANARNAWLGTTPTDDATATRRRAALRTALVALNEQILQDLACASDEVELAYEVGRSLRDTASLPPLDTGATRTDDELRQALVHVLGQGRIATIQQWLETLSPHLQPNTARVVSASLGRWSEFVGASIDNSRPGSLKGSPIGYFCRTLRSYLLRQGDVWLELLTGTQTTQGLLDPEGYVAAGELSIRRTTKIVLGIVRHYWAALVVLIAALGGVFYLSAAYLGGAGKVWTNIAALGASLGITARGIGSAMARMAKAAERPIFGLEEEDVMAWSVTALPPVRLNGAGIRAIRRAGIAPARRLRISARADVGPAAAQPFGWLPPIAG